MCLSGWDIVYKTLHWFESQRERLHAGKQRIYPTGNIDTQSK